MEYYNELHDTKAIFKSEPRMKKHNGQWGKTIISDICSVSNLYKNILKLMYLYSKWAFALTAWAVDVYESVFSTKHHFSPLWLSLRACSIH